MKTRSRIFLILLIFTLGLAACMPTPPALELSDSEKTQVAQTLTAIAGAAMTPMASATPEPSPVPTGEPSATPAPVVETVSYGPSDWPEGINPLTGLKVEDPAKLDRMPVIVKVSNWPATGRPHSGLSFADIVFDYWIGGGSNRFSALYYGQDSNSINPVRSVRRIDGQLGKLYNAILAFSGGDGYKVIPNIINDVGYRFMMEGTCPGVCDDGHRWVTTVYADSEAITASFKNSGVDKGAPNLDGMLFSTAVPEGGEEGTTAQFFYNAYNKAEWRYDAESGKYLRWIDNQESPTWELMPLVDKLTDEQITASNVILIKARHTPIEEALINIDVYTNTEGQEGLLFRDGKAWDITWKATAQDAPLQFFDKAGNPIALKPGNTWITIFGTSSLLTSPEEGTLRYDFQMP